MAWSGAIKNTNVELPDDLHQAIKEAAVKRRTTIKQAYLEALEGWLQESPSISTESPVAQIDTSLGSTLSNKLVVALQRLESAGRRPEAEALAHLIVVMAQQGAITGGNRVSRQKTEAISRELDEATSDLEREIGADGPASSETTPREAKSGAPRRKKR